jgi:hypothetical protein
MGDPYQDKTFLGPMIDESESIRLTQWIQEANQKGAKTLCGGKNDRAFMRAFSIFMIFIQILYFFLIYFFISSLLSISF